MAVSICLGAMLAAQSRSPAPEQSPRKALLEMLLGGDDALSKHLTLEVQRKIGQTPGALTSAGGNPLQLLTLARAAGGENLETFEAGPVLFSYENHAQHQKFEVRIDGDELRGAEDQMRLSLHSFRNGLEEELPATIRFTLSWKAQQNIWRLNAITLNATVPIGDPRILDPARTMPAIGQVMSSPAGHANSATGVNTPMPAPSTGERLAATPQASGTRPVQPAQNDPPSPSLPAQTRAGNSDKLSPARAVRLIGLAEDIYAQKHPATGFTCFLSELVNVGRGFEDGEPYKFIEPELAEGVYNGYRFMLTACTGSPVKSFQVVAEPANGIGRAYCSSPTHELRGSDDGHGASCLESGRVVQR